MTSSYTVPKNSNGMQVSEHIPGHDKHENELQSIADLPKFLRWGSTSHLPGGKKHIWLLLPYS